MTEKTHEAILIISRSNSTCGGCGDETLPREETHHTVSGYGPKRPGCGARFIAMTTDLVNLDDDLRQRMKDIRPDLPIVDTWAAWIQSPVPPDHPAKEKDES